MAAIASQITSLTIVYSTVYSGADQSKHQSSASLAFVRGIRRGPVNSPHKWPVTRKCFHLMTSSCERVFTGFPMSLLQPLSWLLYLLWWRPKTTVLTLLIDVMAVMSLMTVNCHLVTTSGCPRVDKNGSFSASESSIQFNSIHIWWLYRSTLVEWY